MVLASRSGEAKSHPELTDNANERGLNKTGCSARAQLHTDPAVCSVAVVSQSFQAHEEMALTSLLDSSQS
jgi:hypothetical protein